MNPLCLPYLKFNVLKYCNLWDLGRLCKTSSTLYKDAQQHYRRNTPRLFEIKFDVSQDIHKFRAIQQAFVTMRLRRFRLMHTAISFLETKSVVHNSVNRFFYIEDSWSAYRWHNGKKQPFLKVKNGRVKWYK